VDDVVVDRSGGVELYQGRSRLCCVCDCRFGDVEVNGPPGRNVNNFTIVAIRGSLNTEIRGENLQGVGFLW
jgi:hypothetical protein